MCEECKAGGELGGNWQCWCDHWSADGKPCHWCGRTQEQSENLIDDVAWEES